MKQNTTAIPEWQQERIETTKLMWKHVLDPIMTFAELVRGYDDERGCGITPQEISAVLRLLVIGGYTEPKLYCTFGGSLSHVSGEELEKTVKGWDGEAGEGE